MQILHKKLPIIWPLQVGECPTPAAEAAAALLELARRWAAQPLRRPLKLQAALSEAAALAAELVANP